MKDIDALAVHESFQALYSKLEFWLMKTITMIPNFVLAVIIILTFYLLKRLFVRYGNRVLLAFSENLVVNKLVLRMISLSTMATGAFISLGVLHLDKTLSSLLAGIGIVGLAMSFAFQHTAADVLSGIIISLRSTLKIGDLISTNGQFGNVLHVGLRMTRILNVKGQHVEIPNRLVMDVPLVEYSQTGFRRIDVKGQMNFREDLDTLRLLIEETMAQFDFIYKEKQPNMVYNAIENEKVTYTLRVWMNFSENDGAFLNARSACIIKLSELFREHQIEIPTEEVVYISKSN